MKEKQRAPFLIISLFICGFLLFKEFYFFAALLAASEIILILTLIQTGNMDSAESSRPVLFGWSFVSFLILFLILFQGKYDWEKIFDWPAARAFHLQSGGELLLLVSTCVVFFASVCTLIVRREK